MSENVQFEKVTDIRNLINGKLLSYKWENIDTFDFTDVEFTTKKAELKLKLPNKDGHLVQSLTIYANMNKKNEESLFIHSSVNIDNYWRGIGMPSDEHLSNIISILCSYWIYYRDFKKMKRVIFEWTDSRKTMKQNVFSEAMTKVGFAEVNYSNAVLASGWGGVSGGSTFRDIYDNDLIKAEYIQEQIEAAKSLYPSFVVEKHCDEIIKIYGNTYFYENERFKILLNEEQDRLLLKRETKETLSFDLKDEVILNVLSVIREEMKLLNLLKPATKQIFHFCKNYIKVKDLVEENLEEKIRELDDKIGIGKTENEFYLINQMVSNQKEERDKNYRVTKDKIIFFRMPEESTSYFREHYGDEFDFFCFKTVELNWFVMYSSNEKNIWFYPTLNEEMPKDAKEEARKVFETRRNELAMKKFNEAIESLQFLAENNPVKITRFRTSRLYKELKGTAETEFGLKWREECGFVK